MNEPTCKKCQHIHVFQNKCGLVLLCDDVAILDECECNYTEESPNVYLSCSICAERIYQVCMLSPNWSVVNMMTCAVIPLREHLKLKHGIDQPKEI